MSSHIFPPKHAFVRRRISSHSEATCRTFASFRICSSSHSCRTFAPIRVPATCRTFAPFRICSSSHSCHTFAPLRVPANVSPLYSSAFPLMPAHPARHAVQSLRTAPLCSLLPLPVVPSLPSAQTRFRSVLIARTRTKQIKFSISTVQIVPVAKQYGLVGKVITGRPEIPSSILAQCIL